MRLRRLRVADPVDSEEECGPPSAINTPLVDVAVPLQLAKSASAYSSIETSIN